MSLRLSLLSLIRRRRASIEVSNATSSYKALLERRIDVFERLAHIGAAAVVVGVIVEYKTALGEFLQTWNVCILIPAIGGILIALGVGLETLMGMLASSSEHKLRGINAREIADLNSQAEQDRLKRVEIEERIADRVIKPEQIDRIVEGVKSFLDQSFVVTAPFATREVLRFIQSLGEILFRAGWKQGGIAAYTEAAPDFFVGVRVSIVVSASDSTRMAATSLLRALNAEDVMARGPSSVLPSAFAVYPQDNELVANIIIVNVGIKP